MIETVSYRQELEILEELENVLEYSTENIPLEEIIWETSAQWPNDNHTERRTQWIMAGYPDLNDEYEEDVTLYLSAAERRSIHSSLHLLIGVALSDIARQYIHNLIDTDEDTHETALVKIAEAISQHRNVLNLSSGDHAMSAPYNYALMYANQERHDVYVTAT